MPTASTLDVVDVYATTIEDRCGVFEEAGFVEAISMDVALDVVLFAYTTRVKSALPHIARTLLLGRLTSNNSRWL